MSGPFPFLAVLVFATCTLMAQPYPKWLAIGDSITLHGPKEDLGWLGTPRGMAASEPDKDYITVLKGLLRGADPANASDVKIVGRLGKLSGGTIEQMNTVLDELKAWQADLVTIQLGENDPLAEIGEAEFEKRYRSLLDALLADGRKPLIICTGVWLPGVGLDAVNPAEYQRGSEGAIKDAIIRKLCVEKGLRYVSVAPVAANPANHGYGETPGVRWHPNDSGMKGYADAIFATFQKNP